jgi:hypothetical protein
VPLVAAAGCGAGLVAAAVDTATVKRPAWLGVALAATSVALAAGRTATDGIGAIAALVVVAAASVVAGRPSVRVWATAASGLVAAIAGVVSLRSATNSWQLPLADAAANHRGDGLLILVGAVLLVLAGSQRARRPVGLLVPAGAFLAAQAAPLVHRADGLGPAAILLALGAAAVALAARFGQAAFHRPAAALTLLALAALVTPGAARGPALLLAAAGTLACPFEWPGVAALGVPGGVGFAVALAARGGTTAFVVGALAGLVAVVLAAVAAREEEVPRLVVWAAPVLALGIWLLVAPGTWGWVGPTGLRSYDLGAARAAAAAALCLIVLVHLGRAPVGWYAQAFPPDSPGEDAARH